ncbi:MAG: S16 family serine protease, partial [Halomonas sp.]
IKTVLIPEENRRDLKEVPDNIKGALDIRPVRWIDDVLAVALADKVEKGAQLKNTEASFNSDVVASTH